MSQVSDIAAFILAQKGGGRKKLSDFCVILQQQ
jgi:hypothetical protein